MNQGYFYVKPFFLMYLAKPEYLKGGFPLIGYLGNDYYQLKIKWLSIEIHSIQKESIHFDSTCPQLYC